VPYQFSKSMTGTPTGLLRRESRGFRHSALHLLRESLKELRSAEG
jgi:hypothetical protein